MDKLIELRNKIETFYLKHERIGGFIIRMLLTFVCLLITRNIIDFNPVLSSFWVVALISVACGFVPVRFLPLVIITYTLVHVFTLSMALGIVILMILVVMYLLFYRFAPEYAVLLMVMPLALWLKVPILPVMALAVLGPAISSVTVIFGTVYYFLIHFLNANAATFAEATGTLEFTKVELLVEGVFINKEFLYTVVILFVVFMIVHFLKRINVNHSIEIALAIGTGAYIILTLSCELALRTLTSGKLTGYVIGGLVAGVLAIVILNFWYPLDYVRTETVEFEDDEYSYYVKAVPKASFEKERVQIKRINKRKVL